MGVAGAAAMPQRAFEDGYIDGWQWVNYWYPLRQVVSFKREVYRRALREMVQNIFPNSIRGWGVRPLDHLLSDAQGYF